MFADLPVRKQQAAGGRRKQQGARSTDGLFGLALEGREEGVRCTQAAGKRAQQLNSCIGDGWSGSETEERKSGGEYIRETLMGLAQINKAQ
jgi:hypothetical protein